MGEFFRAGVGIIVRRRSTGDVAVFERIDRVGAWQYPQGGIEVGEEPIDAVWRELDEETGLTADDVELVGEHQRWTTYEVPVEARSAKTGRGQTQRWFLFDVAVADPPIVLDGHGEPEFGSWRWVLPDEAARSAVPFRRAIYEELAAWLDVEDRSRG